MKTIYIDTDYICHAENDGARTEITTDALDNICNSALECYRFVPQGSVWKGKTYANDFIQCVDCVKEKDISKAYNDGIDSQTETIAGLMDDIESLCNEIIGE